MERRTFLQYGGLSAATLASAAFADESPNDGGKTYRVLVTGFEDGFYTGRSAMEAPDSDGLIYFTAERELDAGAFVPVRIARADTYDLYGIMEGET